MSNRMMCYGDSNTYGYDPRSYLGGRYPESVRWTALLKANSWEIINEGENGRSIPRLDGEIKATVQIVHQANPNILVVMLGTNDLLQRPGLAAEICAQRMKDFLSALLTEASADLKVLLIAPPPVEPGTWVPDPALIQESRRLAGCYEALARDLGIRFADAGNWGVKLAFDGVNFSEAGHRTFAKRILEMLAAMN